MAAYRELAPELLSKLLEPYQDSREHDLLQSERRKEDAYYRQHQCSRCGSGNLSRVFANPQHAYAEVEGEKPVLPRYVLKCEECEAEEDPRTGILLKIGNLGKAVERHQARGVPTFTPESD